MMARRSRRLRDPDQFDLFEPPHECCEDARGPYLQFLIAPPTELGEPGTWTQERAPVDLPAPGALTAS